MKRTYIYAVVWGFIFAGLLNSINIGASEPYNFEPYLNNKGTVRTLTWPPQAGKHDITIEQGATWRYQIVWTDADGDSITINNPDYDVTMQIRKRVSSSDTLLTASTDNGYITVSSSLSGTFFVTIPAARTAQLNFRTAYYDIELSPSTNDLVYRILQGRCKLNKEVTR